ncbi:MAG: NYN domain-containing protein [Bacteroidota bacterium]
MRHRELVIDGYNLLHAIPNRALGRFPHDLLRARGELLALLERYAYDEKRYLIVVFDNKLTPAPESYSTARVRVEFTNPSQNADEWIRGYVESHAHPSLLTVVSSDIEIARFVQAMGAVPLRSEEFAIELFGQEKDVEKPDAPLNDDEVQKWAKIFDIRRKP